MLTNLADSSNCLDTKHLSKSLDELVLLRTHGNNYPNLKEIGTLRIYSTEPTITAPNLTIINHIELVYGSAPSSLVPYDYELHQINKAPITELPLLLAKYKDFPILATMLQNRLRQ